MTENELLKADPRDLSRIKELLRICELPNEDIEAAYLEHFLILRDGGQLISTVGLEILGEAALLRSLAVRPTHRRQGYASELVRQIEEFAHSQHVDRLYMLTTTAEGFFAKYGYERTKRAEVPTAVAGTTEFASLCPDSAVCMVKKLSD
jgi:amino-acid N-acetyltransferase